MNLRNLALISMMVLGLAISGRALAEESDKDKDAHHPEAAATSSSDAAVAPPSVDDDKAATEAMKIDGGDMMMCGRMMAMMGDMMKGGGEEAGHRAMKGPDMHGMMKGQGPMIGRDSMKGHGKGGMKGHGFAHLLSADQVTKRLSKMIADNERLKIGKIEPGGDFSFAAEITTVDGSLVHKLMVDRRDGQAWEVD